VGKGRSTPNNDTFQLGEAFMKMLGKRTWTTINQDGTILFRLFDLTIPPSTPDQLIILRGSIKHLRLDCLSG
jgi:hypothetical protein